MDNASARLSRAMSALSLAMKAGPEASKGELLDAIASVFEHVEAAAAALGAEEPRAVEPGPSAPAACEPRAKVYPLPAVSSAN